MDDTKDRRQVLLDQLGEVLGELFCEGIDELGELAKRSIVDGLASKRIQVKVQIKMPPLHIAFGVARENCDPVALFEISDPSEKSLKVTFVDPQTGALVN
jgi:hypothetical protein